MYNCKIYHDYNEPIVLLDICVETLKDLAQELDMTYQQVADLIVQGKEEKQIRKKKSFKVN